CNVIAEQVGAKEGDRVRMGGIELEVAGIFDAKAFDEKVLLLGGDSIAPLKYSSGMLDVGGRAMSDSAAESLDLDADTTAGEMASSYDHLPSTQFVIVPAAVSRLLPGGSLRSAALRLNDGAEVKKVSDELSRRFALAMFAGFDDGVKMVAASNL